MTAISGCFAEYQMVKTRGVLVLKIEIPLERQAEVFAVLGYPLPGEEIHVGLARLQNPQHPAAAHAPADGSLTPEAGPHQPAITPERATRGKAQRGIDLAQLAKAELQRSLYSSLSPEDRAVRDAGMLAKDPAFQEWTSYYSETEAAAFIRRACGVTSRRALAESPEARTKFGALMVEFQAATQRMAERRG